MGGIEGFTGLIGFAQNVDYGHIFLILIRTPWAFILQQFDGDTVKMVSRKSVKKLEFADPVYYCRIIKTLANKGIIDSSTESICYKNPEPNCRSCDYRKTFMANSNWRTVLEDGGFF